MVTRDAAGPYGDFEGRAARVVARATGLHTFIQDDNRSPRTPDLRMEDLGRIVGVGEVVTTTDGARAQQLRAFSNGELEFERKELRGTWWVTVTPLARRVGLERTLVDAFSKLEARGDHTRVSPLHPELFPEIAELALLGLTEISCNPTPQDGPGKIHGLPEGIGGPVAIDWDGCAAWISEFLRSDRCRGKVEKLQGAGESHLYVGVTGADPWPVHQALEILGSEVPLPAPDLPDGLTHLWIDDAEFPSCRRPREAARRRPRSCPVADMSSAR